MMMNTKQRILDEKKVKDFVGDFNKHFENLAKRYKKDAEEIGNRREYFWRKYPEIFNDSSENRDEMDVDVDTTMETESRPIVDREEKLRKVEEKLLSKRTNERFTNYDGVMSDDSLSWPQKIIHLQKVIGNATIRKILYASLQGQLLEECFHQSKKVHDGWFWVKMLQIGESFIHLTFSTIVYYFH